MKKKIELPEIPLELKPQSEHAKLAIGFKLAADEMGKRNKIGGIPDFIQEDFFPPCPDCKERMTFYGQLDSIGDAISIADCGMVYVFICFDCYTTQSIIQSH